MKGITIAPFLIHLLYSSFIDGILINECQHHDKRIIGYYFEDNELRPFSQEQAKILTHLILYCGRCSDKIFLMDDYFEFGKRFGFDDIVNIAKLNNVSVMIGFVKSIFGNPFINLLNSDFENALKRILSLFQVNEWVDGIEFYADMFYYADNMEEQIKLERRILQFLCNLRHEFNKFDRNLLISYKEESGILFDYYTNWLVEALNHLDFISINTKEYYFPTSKSYNPTTHMNNPITYASAPLYSTHYAPSSINNTMRIFACNFGKLEKFNIMVPFYGIVWKDVSSKPLKLKWKSESQSIRYRAQSPAQSTIPIPWRDINKDFDLNMEKYHEESETPFIMNKAKHEFISYENKRSIAKKMEFLYEYGIGGIHIQWINYDDDNLTLLNTIAEYKNYCINNTLSKYNCDNDTLIPLKKWNSTNFSGVQLQSKMVKTEITENFWLTIGIIAFMAIIIFIFLFCLFFVRQKRNRKAYNSLITPNPLENEKINYILIGKGRFDEAFLCELNKREKRIIKVRHRQNEWSKMKMVKEMNAIAELDHPNICAFHGLVKLDGNRLGQIFDYAPLGDLLNFFANLPTISNQIKSPLITKPWKLLRIALMIADGLKYLKMKNIVHGNLHLKNCLVFEYSSFEEEENYIVKLTDYSQMKFIVESDFYKQLKEMNLSKFIAPEVLSKQKFSFASDIWSFGSILYCIFSENELNKLISQKNATEITKAASSEKTNNNIFPSSFPFPIETLVIRCWMHFPQHRIDIVDAYNYLLQLDINDLRNKMEMNVDDLDNIDPMDLDIDSQEFFDAISHSDSNRIDLTQYLDSEIDEMDQNDMLNNCITPPSTVFMPQIPQINLNEYAVGCSSHILEMEQNQPLLYEMNNSLPLQYLDFQQTPPQLMAQNPPQILPEPEQIETQSFEDKIIQLRRFIIDASLPQIPDSYLNQNPEFLSGIITIFEQIFIRLEPFKIELNLQLQNWIAEQKNFSFGSHDRRGVLHMEELRLIINENYRQFAELLEKCLQKIENLTKDQYLNENLAMIKHKFLRFTETFLCNSIIISQQPPSYVERVQDKTQSSLYIFPIEISALGFDVFLNLEHYSKFEIVGSIIQVDHLNNQWTCQISRHFQMEQKLIENNNPEGFISERFNVKIKSSGIKIGRSKMNQHVPEQPHFIQFYMEIKCLNYGMKLQRQLNSLKFCVVTNRNFEVEAKAFLLRAFPTEDGNAYRKFVDQHEMEDALDYKFNSILSSPVSHSKQRSCNSERQLDRTMKSHLSQMLEVENGLIKTNNFLEKEIFDENTKESLLFYEWFFGLAAEFIKEDNLMLKMWNKGLIYGFCSDEKATELVMGRQYPVILIRFSNSEPKSVRLTMKDVHNPTEVKHYGSSLKNAISVIKELILFNRKYGVQYIYPRFNIQNEILQLNDPECTNLFENYQGIFESSALGQKYFKNKRPAASIYFRMRGYLSNLQHQIGNTFQ